MFSVLSCIYAQHDLRLVAVATLICAAACSAAFGFHQRSVGAAGSSVRWAWMALTGLVAGSGVWATHFIAMLAYQPTLPIGYDVALTAGSLATAVVGMGAGFALPALWPTRAVALAAGALTGLAVAAMHFMGIDAMRMSARVDWDHRYVTAAILIGTLGAAGAFYARERLQGRIGWFAPAMLLLLSIVGLHFTAMTAVRLVPDPALGVPAHLVGRGALALATVALAGLILAAATSLIWMERFGRNSTLQGLRDALDTLSAGLAFYDNRGRLVAWNRAYADLFAAAGLAPTQGMPRRVMIEAALAAGWAPEGGGPDRRRAYYQSGAAPAVEVRLPDGRWLRHEAFATHDRGGVTMLTDLTEQRETARALGEARDAAEATNRAKSQFLANISHEIRTPLNGVLGVADVLFNTGLNDQQRDLVGVIQTSGALLNALLGDLLDLARAEAGAAELRPQPESLAAVADSVRRLHAPRAEQKGVGLRVEIGADAGAWAACDGMRLRQVIGNLVSNAIKFTDAGEVVIALERSGDSVTFRVRDTGAGFDAATKARLFGRFEQADGSSTRRHGGAGLGLAISREYVRLMGGELDGDSQPGEGAVFSFTLELPALEPPAPAADEPAAGEREAGRFRVLIVDDNEVNRQVMAMILDSIGIDHAEAANGRQGLDAAMTCGFDAVLMDIQMPVMDGFEATRRIRAWEAETGQPRTPILIVSANCLQEHIDAGAAAGADGHLDKPVSVAQLLGALEPYATAALAA
ncbi:ATP-binding protein [Phenylobacterium sp.]|uniref:ATP-binding protein n=1 Tax=Phenylobacterium sp. TaxID=1871053 RepID=UPI0025DBA7E6|nr:ATP-binding protein [Phenylobacterium sp.]